jgi:hypothetical protein
MNILDSYLVPAGFIHIAPGPVNGSVIDNARITALHSTAFLACAVLGDHGPSRQLHYATARRDSDTTIYQRKRANETPPGIGCQARAPHLLMRFGGDPIRGSNPRSSAQLVKIYRTQLQFAGGACSGCTGRKHARSRRRPDHRPRHLARCDDFAGFIYILPGKFIGSYRKEGPVQASYYGCAGSTTSSNTLPSGARKCCQK